MSNRNIEAVSDSVLVDLFGDADAVLKAKEEYRDKLKEEILKRKLKDGTSGKHYSLKISTFARWTLATDRIKEAMGEAWVTAFSKVTNVTRVSAAILRRP